MESSPTRASTDSAAAPAPRRLASQPSRPSWREWLRLPRSRRAGLAGFAIAFAGPGLVSLLALIEFERALIPGLLYLPSVVAATLIGGFVPGLVASLFSVVLLDYLFVEPTNRFNAPTAEEMAALVIFFFVCALFSFVLAREHAARRGVEAAGTQLDVIVGGVAEGITAVDRSGHLLYANEAAARLLGFPSPYELMATPITEILARYEILRESGEPFPLEELPGRRALLGEEPPDALIRFRSRASGEERWSRVHASPVRHETGEVAFAIYIWHDVTEEKRNETRQRFLAAASELLGSSLNYDETLSSVARLAVPWLADWSAVHVVHEDGELLPLVVAHVDPAKVTLARELSERYPVKPDDPGGVPAVIRSGQPLLLPDVPDEFLVQATKDEEQLRIVRELGLRSIMIVPLLTRERAIGAITFVSAESSRRYDEQDLLVAKDLARRAAVAVDNARLFREAETRGRAAVALSHVADGVVLVDPAGLVRLWNPAAEVITGIPAEDALGKSMEQALPAWRQVEGLVPIASSPEPTAAQAVPIELDGNEVWLAVSAVGFDEGTVYAFRDLTEERRIEAMKTDFLATASHELRTPLAAVYGATMTLRRADLELDDVNRDRLLEMIASESERLTRIVDDILWASRVDSGQLTFAIGRCDLGRIAREVVAAARAHAPRGLHIDFSMNGPLPSVSADPDKVRQVLTNLIDNAVKYSPDGGPIDVRLETHSQRVLISVRDEGLGIPLQEQNRIFDKFYRLDPGLTRGVGGTGLGLYICRELVRRMGGRIWVASREGEGSIFFFELPVA